MILHLFTHLMEEINEQSKELNDNANLSFIDEEPIQHLNNPVANLKPIVKKYLTEAYSGWCQKSSSFCACKR